MEHIIYRTQLEKQKVNELCLKQECINKIAQHMWFSQLDKKFEKIKDLNISLWDKFHSEHRKIINDLIDQEIYLPRILKWKIKNQCEILIHSLKYFYLVYLRVQNERYVNDIIQDQEIQVHNLVWLKCGMVDRQRSLINLILPILNEFNTSNLFTIGYKFCLPQLLVQVYQASDCKLGMNLDVNDVHSFLYIYFICYCKIYIENLNKEPQEKDEINKENESSSGQTILEQNENNVFDDQPENRKMSRVRNIEEDTEFKTKLSKLFKDMRFVDIDWLVLMNHGDDNVLTNLINNYDIDHALTIYSFLTRNKMAFEYFWQRVDDGIKQELCNYLIEFLRFIPTFHNVFYFLIMYEYLPLSFKHFIQNNESMKKLNQLSMLNYHHTSVDNDFLAYQTLHLC